MDDQTSPEQNIKKLSQQQKIGVVLLLVFGVLAVGLGLLQIRNTMYAPFALTNTVPPDVKDAITDQNALQYRDTDGDGLSDFQELYVYNTSQYLADTDSDGITDKAEITQGKNPNCAEGKSCSNYLMDGQYVASNSASGTINGMDVPAETGSVTDLMKDIQDPKKVRELILASGSVDKATLDKIPDDVLMVLVQQQTAASFQALGIPFVSVGATTSATTSPIK